jgi:hypothetical protein
MPILEFSQREILRSKIVEPAWYRILIEEVGEKPSSKGDSINYPIDATIKFNGDTGDTTFTGVPISWFFNSKGQGFIIPFIEAVTGESVMAGKRIELKAAEGREVDVYITTGMFNNRPKNDVTGQYRTPKPEVTARQ